MLKAPEADKCKLLEATEGGRNLFLILIAITVPASILAAVLSFVCVEKPAIDARVVYKNKYDTR